MHVLLCLIIEQSEKVFLNELKALPDSNFKKMLKEDEDKYLPSIVDKLYHRGILTSNYAEVVFSALKRDCNFTKHSLLATLNGLMKISCRWMTKSMKEIIKTPAILMNLYKANVGNFALNYLLKEINTGVENGEECKCNNIHKLPCRHIISQNINVITDPKIIPKEYFLMNERNCVEQTLNNTPNCSVEETIIQLKPLSIENLISRVKRHKGSTEIINKISEMLTDFLKTENSDIVTKKIYNPS